MLNKSSTRRDSLGPREWNGTGLRDITAPHCFGRKDFSMLKHNVVESTFAIFPLASDVVVYGVCLSFTFHFQLTVLHFISAAFQPFIHSVAVRSRTVQVVFRCCCCLPSFASLLSHSKKILDSASCRTWRTHIRVSTVGRSSLNKKKEHLKHSSLEKVEWTNRRGLFGISE